MNLNCQKNSPFASSWLGWLGVAVYLLLCSPARAQIEERWLLVFDTSAAMKKRLPNVEAALKKFLETSGGGQIHADDSVGVWTFCQQLHTGEFPLTTWLPEQSALTATNLIKFVHRQWFAGNTSLDALQPLLGRVIADSDRLTVLIFCDGSGQMDWTPYDSGINQTFRQNFAERQKLRQPFVVLLRTQQGKFTGCSVSFPPGEINIPAFPAWPEPPKPAVAAPPIPPPAPAVTSSLPALIIIGKTVGTNADQVEKMTNQQTSMQASNPVVAKPAAAIVTNPPARVIAPLPTAKVNGLTKRLKGEERLFLFTAGGTLLVVGLLLILLAVARSRRPSNSLITDSLNAPKLPPQKK
jgi:hypothetical protein